MKKILGISFITFGLLMCLNNFTFKYNSVMLENKKVNNTFKNIVDYKNIDNNKYTSVLSIPKINLRKGIYDINDSKNNIDENIMIDKHSIYPDKTNSNVILVAHSGMGNKAYFNDLKELDTDSLVEFYYEHNKYIYKIDNIYYVTKTGKVDIKRNKNKKTITLITCRDMDVQVVYVGYLIDEVEY